MPFARYRTKFTTGFTIVELLVGVAIIALIVAFVFVTFVNVYNNQALEKDVQVIQAILNEARAKTLGYENKSQYGVHFTSTSSTLFRGTSFNPTAADNQLFKLHSLVTIGTINLTGGGSEVVFERLTGITNQFGTTTVTTKRGSESKDIVISATGIVTISD